MDKISFKAGYGNDYNNTDEKYKRYDDIDKIIKEYNEKNKELQAQLEPLKEQRRSLMTSIRNVPGMDNEETRAKIEELEAQIYPLENEIQNNKDYTNHLWYDHHERT